MDDSTTTLGNSDINIKSIRHQVLLYLFCLKVYFSNPEKRNENKSMLQNVIELGKSGFGKALNNILGAIYFKNIEKKERMIKEIKVKEIKEVKME